MAAWTNRRSLAALAGLGLLGLSACVAPPPAGAAYPPVPPLREEIQIAPPPQPERYVWQPGHWVWNGYRYDWNAGRWVLRPVRGEHWVHGHWAAEGGRWVWVPPHWQ
jgi:hypothetical protein